MIGAAFSHDLVCLDLYRIMRGAIGGIEVSEAGRLKAARVYLRLEPVARADGKRWEVRAHALARHIVEKAEVDGVDET